MADFVPAAADTVATADPPEPAPPSSPNREYALVPLAEIQLHPLNLRRELRDIDELADSIRQNGLLEPVLLVPAPDGSEQYVLIAGHRRHAACTAAGHDPVESIIRRDLDSEGAQIIAMLTENGPRDDLTPIEEARGYQLALQLNGLSPTRLAKRLGKPRATIASRVALTRLPEPVQDRIHTRQITLVEAEALVEFTSDAGVFDELLGQVGTPNFRYQLERERRRRAQQARIAELRRQLEETGVRVIEPPARFSWGSVEKPVTTFIDPSAPARDDGSPEHFTAAAHAAACSFHAVFVDPNDVKAVYVCTNPAEARHSREVRTYSPPLNGYQGPGAAAAAAPTPEQVRAAEEAERAELQRRAEAERARAERREALEVAGRLRGAFLAGALQRSGKAHLAGILKLLLTDHLLAWLDDACLEDIEELARLVDARLTPAPDVDGDADDHLAEASRALQGALDSRRSPDALAAALLAIAAQDREFALREGFGWGDERCRRYVRFLIAEGYEPTPFERELLERDDPDTSDEQAVATV